ncbi:hypothetical protein QBC43DRAFT_314568 [Cladorrhinum sp. PSN259]|nr:hypothetical protein QBC43DRAFT_314568 [Cladorrhinum sp. PSN259]
MGLIKLSYTLSTIYSHIRTKNPHLFFTMRKPQLLLIPQKLGCLQVAHQIQSPAFLSTLTTFSSPSSSSPLLSSPRLTHRPQTRHFSSITPSMNPKPEAEAEPKFSSIPTKATSYSKIVQLNKLLKTDWRLSIHPHALPQCSCLSITYRFKTFDKAFGFMKLVAKKAAEHRHHPEWSNIYNIVHIRWTTHDNRTGLTHKDFEMAWECEVLSKEMNGTVEPSPLLPGVGLDALERDFNLKGLADVVFEVDEEGKREGWKEKVKAEFEDEKKL